MTSHPILLDSGFLYALTEDEWTLKHCSVENASQLVCRTQGPDSEVELVIDLHGGTITEEQGFPRCFKVATADQAGAYFMAKTPEEAQSWIASLRLLTMSPDQDDHFHHIQSTPAQPPVIPPACIAHVTVTTPSRIEQRFVAVCDGILLFFKFHPIESSSWPPRLCMRLPPTSVLHGDTIVFDDAIQVTFDDGANAASNFFIIASSHNNSNDTGMNSPPTSWPALASRANSLFLFPSSPLMATAGEVYDLITAPQPFPTGAGLEWSLVDSNGITRAKARNSYQVQCPNQGSFFLHVGLISNIQDWIRKGGSGTPLFGSPYPMSIIASSPFPKTSEIIPPHHEDYYMPHEDNGHETIRFIHIQVRDKFGNFTALSSLEQIVLVPVGPIKLAIPALQTTNTIGVYRISYSHPSHQALYGSISMLLDGVAIKGSPLRIVSTQGGILQERITPTSTATPDNTTTTTTSWSAASEKAGRFLGRSLREDGNHGMEFSREDLETLMSPAALRTLNELDMTKVPQEPGKPLLGETLDEIFEILTKAVVREQMQSKVKEPSAAWKRSLARLRGMLAAPQRPTQRMIDDAIKDFDNSLLESSLPKPLVERIRDSLWEYVGGRDWRGDDDTAVVAMPTTPPSPPVQEMADYTPPTPPIVVVSQSRASPSPPPPPPPLLPPPSSSSRATPVPPKTSPPPETAVKKHYNTPRDNVPPPPQSTRTLARRPITPNDSFPGPDVIRNPMYHWLCSDSMHLSPYEQRVCFEALMGAGYVDFSRVEKLSAAQINRLNLVFDLRLKLCVAVKAIGETRLFDSGRRVAQ